MQNGSEGQRSKVADVAIKVGVVLAVTATSLLLLSGIGTQDQPDHGGWWRVIGWVGVALLADSITVIAIGFLARGGRDMDEAYRLGYDVGYERGYDAGLRSRERDPAA